MGSGLRRHAGTTGDEVLDESVGRVAELVRAAVEVNDAIFQHDDAVGNFEDAGDVVSDDHGGDGIALLQALDEVVDDVGDDGVEAGGGFVVEDDFWTTDNGPGDTDAFAHATGEVDGHFFFVGVEFDDFEGFLHAAFDLSRVFDACLDEWEGDVLGDGQAIEEGSVLEEVTDAAAERREFAFGKAAQGDAVELDGAGVGLEEADDVFE